MFCSGDRMWFAVLGPLLAHDGVHQVDVPKGRQRVLLAALVLHAGTPVAADALAEVMWDGSPSSGATVTLRSHILRLRRALGPRAGARLVTRHPGYVLCAGEEEVDVLRFRRLCRDGGAAAGAGAWARAQALLDEALDLWRGAPLADVRSESLHREVVQDLEVLRLQAEEWRIDAGLHLGSAAELVPGLQSLTAQHPLRERFHGQLMLALYRSSRQAEALAAYQHARHVLVEELGVEPGPGLRELHQRILSGDPALAATEPARPAQAEPQPFTPRELPPAVPGFTGRSGELRALARLFDGPGDQAPETVVISVISGTAGVGKTALAIQWAHQAAGRCPDGQLYVNLRGYDPDQPMSAADALAGFLRSLGVPGQDIPPEEAERAARYRSLLAGKRMLVLLDNAASADQVRPLLPGAAACTVVVTSRDALAGLVARDGATRLDLDVLPLEEAVALLRTLIGARVDAEPAAAAELAGQCCRLPLALRVGAELAASRPGVPLAELTAELTDLHKRLDLLVAGGDRRTAVRAVFSWSYQHLGDDAARTFRLMGLHPGADFEPYAVAALTGLTTERAQQVLDVLARAHLIHIPSPGRYGLHDLLRAYARELAAVCDGAARHEALTRLFDHYLRTATAAMNTLHPAERHWRPLIPLPATPGRPVTSPAAARGWLDAERATLVAITVHAAEHGWPLHAIRIAATLSRYLALARHPEAITIHSYARIAAQQADDSAAEAAALNALGRVAFHHGRYQQATGQLEQALALFRQTGDQSGQAHALANLGVVSFLQGGYAQARERWQRSLALHRENGDQAGQTSMLGNLGLLDLRQGRYQQASERFRQSLALARTTGNRGAESTALVNLGEVSLRQGAYEQATGPLQQALALARESGDRGHEASALVRLGELSLRMRHPEQAAGHVEHALALARQTGDREDEAEALNGLGEVLLAAGQPGRARASHAAALELAAQIGSKYQQARAHNGLGHSCLAGRDPALARHHWQEALALYSDLGAPETGQVRAQLTAAQMPSSAGM
jgi:DNA-binding SARP family transcriptional activator/Tfp pilus assembly protein PilF